MTFEEAVAAEVERAKNDPLNRTIDKILNPTEAHMNNYPPGVSQADHDEAFRDEAPSCPECGSVPCSCHLCVECGDDAPRDNHGRCVQCTHGPTCHCEDCYSGPDRLVDEDGVER